MTRLAVLLLTLLLSIGVVDAAPPPDRVAALRRGVNITGWFRYPPGIDPDALRAWLSDPAMADLHASGFTFVRLAADPAILDRPAMRRTFLDQVRRLQSHGLAVIVSPHPVTWRIDTDAADRARFVSFWRDFAPALRGLPPETTFVEVLNEPVFHNEPAVWSGLQHALLTAIRAALPLHTIVLTGADWGGIAGLLALTPEADANVMYSFHFYDPAELTSLAAYRPGLDRTALARLRFPERDAVYCQHAADQTGDAPTRDLIRFYCATNWDAARVRTRLLEAAAWGKRHKVSLLAGEFGASATLNPDSRLSWLRLVRETCAEAGIGWALWGYDDVMGLNVKRPPGLRPVLDRSVLKALGLTAL